MTDIKCKMKPVYEMERAICVPLVSTKKLKSTQWEKFSKKAVDPNVLID